MTKRQRQQRQTRPARTPEARQALRIDRALNELQRAGYDVKPLGRFEFFISRREPA